VILQDLPPPYSFCFKIQAQKTTPYTFFAKPSGAVVTGKAERKKIVHAKYKVATIVEEDCKLVEGNFK